MKLLNLTVLLVSQALLLNTTLGAAIPKDVISRGLENRDTAPVLASGEKHESMHPLVARGSFSLGRGGSTTGYAQIPGSTAGMGSRTSQAMAGMRSGLSRASTAVGRVAVSAGRGAKSLSRGAVQSLQRAGSRVMNGAQDYNLGIRPPAGLGQTQAGAGFAGQQLDPQSAGLGGAGLNTGLGANSAALGTPGMGQNMGAGMNGAAGMAV